MRRRTPDFAFPFPYSLLAPITRETPITQPSAMEDYSSADSEIFFGLKEVPLPLWLKENPLCNVEDWKAFIKKRFDGTTRHDWVSD